MTPVTHQVGDRLLIDRTLSSQHIGWLEIGCEFRHIGAVWSRSSSG